MNIFLRELKAHRKAIIIWSIAMIIFVYAGMQKYGTMVGQDGAEEFMNIINAMPRFLQAMLGISSLDITSPIGYYGVLFSYLLFMAAIHASMLGSNIIVKEERDKTAEFLMAKPVSRKRIVTFKLLASLINILIFNLVTFITCTLILKNFTSEAIGKEMILSIIGCFFVQIIFLSIGVGIASIFKKYNKAGVTTMGIMLFTFVLSLIIDISDKINFLKIFTPFQYFEAKDFIVNGSLNIWFILLTMGIVGIILFFAYKEYAKRDLNI